MTWLHKVHREITLYKNNTSNIDSTLSRLSGLKESAGRRLPASKKVLNISLVRPANQHNILCTEHEII